MTEQLKTFIARIKEAITAEAVSRNEQYHRLMRDPKNCDDVEGLGGEAAGLYEAVRIIEEFEEKDKETSTE